MMFTAIIVNDVGMRRVYVDAAAMVRASQTIFAALR